MLSDDFAIEWSCIPHFITHHFTAMHIHLEIFLHCHYSKDTKKKEKILFHHTLIFLLQEVQKNLKKLLSEYGFDIRSTKFWQEGFDYVNEQVKALSSLN